MDCTIAYDFTEAVKGAIINMDYNCDELWVRDNPTGESEILGVLVIEDDRIPKGQAYLVDTKQIHSWPVGEK